MWEDTYPISFTKEGQHRIQTDRRTRKPDPDILRKPRYGRITKITNPFTESGGRVIYVHIRFDDNISEISQESTARPYVLTHTPEEIALIYGDELVGLRCRIDYAGANRDQGYATIIGQYGRGDLEKAHKLRDFGTLLAPAGSGGTL